MGTGGFFSFVAGIGVGRKPTHLTAQEKSPAPRLGKRASCYNTEKRNGERECNNKKHAGRKKYNWYAHSDGVIIMQSKIGQGWYFLLLRKCLLVSFCFGVNIIHCLLYNVIW